MTRKLFAFCLLFSLSLQVSPITIYAQEQAYQITKTELMQLETIFNKQLKIINQLQTELKLLAINETEAMQQLTIASKELQKMQKELMLLKEDLTNSKIALAKANQSLQEYEKEMKRKTQIIKRQRNFAYSLTIGSLVYAATK